VVATDGALVDRHLVGRGLSGCEVSSDETAARTTHNRGHRDEPTERNHISAAFALRTGPNAGVCEPNWTCDLRDPSGPICFPL